MAEMTDSDRVAFLLHRLQLRNERIKALKEENAALRAIIIALSDGDLEIQPKDAE